MPKAVRMADIAKEVGVSTVTVSKALADKDGVSDEIRTKIKETAQAMGYRQTNVSRRSHPGSTGNIGILIPSCFLAYRSNSFYWDLYEKVVSRLMANNYYGILELISDDAEQNLLLPRVLKDNKIDGLIMIGQTSPEYRRMLQSKMFVPTVFLDTYDSCGTGFSVISDGYYGMYAVTSYLLTMGHKDICFVGTVNSTSSISDRYFGYRRAMAQYGIPVAPEMVLPDRNEHGEIDFILPEKLPTAFACNCDITAYEVINRLEARNLHVPDDVSVAGFDNYSVPCVSVPKITTYAVDMGGMARACVDALLHQMEHKHPSSGIKIVSGHLIVRHSVKNLQGK